MVEGWRWKAVRKRRWRWAFLVCWFGLLSLVLSGCRGTRNLQLVARVGRETAGRSLAVYKDYILAAAGYNGLCIVNVQDPRRPVKEGCLGADVYEVVVADDKAYAASLDGLLILDLADPRAPQVIGRYDIKFLPSEMAVQGDYLYLGNIQKRKLGRQFLLVLDISDPAHPALAWESDFRDVARDISIEDVIPIFRYVYVVLSWSAGSKMAIQVLDTSSADELSIVGTIPIESRSYIPDHIEVIGEHGYTAGLNIVSVLDLSDPLHPVPIGRVELENIGIFNGMAVSEPYVYLADIFGLRVVDVSDPTRPREIGHYKLAQGGDVVELPSGDSEPGGTRHVAVIDKDDGLLIFSFRP